MAPITQSRTRHGKLVVGKVFAGRRQQAKLVTSPLFLATFLAKASKNQIILKKTSHTSLEV